MSKNDFLSQLIQPTVHLSNAEHMLLELLLFEEICRGLMMNFNQVSNGANDCQFYKNKENTLMLYGKLINTILQDLISSDFYSLDGVANYANVPEEIVEDILLGRNESPSIDVARNIIELHRLARPALYQSIIEKIYRQDSLAMAS